MEITECEDLEVVAADGTLFGRATIQDDTLYVSPEGKVVVDMGNIKGFQALTSVVDESGKEKTVWLGEIMTNRELTIRTTDNKEKVIFSKINQQT